MLTSSPQTMPTGQAVRVEIRQPGRLPDLLADACLAIGCFLLTYRLRFPGEELAPFLGPALRSLPLVAGGQIAGLLAAGLYRRRTAGRARRLVIGATAGTLAGAAAAALIVGTEGLSRMAFAVDLVLFLMAATAWRAFRILWLGSARAGGLRPDARGLVDRSGEVASLRGSLHAILQHRELLKNLVLKDLKLKYRGSVLGFLWSLVNPLMMIVVYSVAFTYILRVQMEGFTFFLLLGILAWTFFLNSATMSTGAIVESGGLIKSVFFPRAILPVSTVLFNLAQYLLTIVVFLPLMLIAYQVPLSGAMLLYPVLLFLQVIFTVGVALLVSAGTAFFRDLKHLLDVALSVLFWTTPILYPLSQVPEVLRLPLSLTPVSPFIVGYQSIFYYGVYPDPWLWLVAATYAAGTFLAGAALFLVTEDRFAELI